MNDVRTEALLHDLPGGMRALRGLRDLREGRWTLEAMWLSMARTRLAVSGIEVQDGSPEVHLALHAACVAADGRAGHATYRALNEELSSFLDALEARRRRAARDR